MTGAAAIPTPSVDRITSDLEALAAFRDPAAPGWTRRVFSSWFRDSREWIAERMRDAGLEVHIDAATNVVGHLPGSEPELPALVTGSHTDTVHGGGRFDGIAGVLAGIEAARVLARAGGLRHPLRVVDFAGEEPNDFGVSCVGSRALTGQLAQAHLDLTDQSGATLGDVLAASGGDPARALELSWRPEDVAAFLELHVEQGPVLERSSVPIGVVTGIVGIHRLVADFLGQPDHAGTTPMTLRRDAACAAAEAVLAVETLAGEDDQAVATTGRLRIQPGASNIVPGHAWLSAEFRSLSAEWLEAQHDRVAQAFSEAADRRDVELDLRWLTGEEPADCSSAVITAIERAADELGVEHVQMPSGAGHDAVMLAALTSIGMVFVPSQGGRSHVPEEWSEPADIARGTHVLAQALAGLDTQTGPSATEGRAARSNAPSDSEQPTGP